jgi:hypothetical protein
MSYTIPDAFRKEFADNFRDVVQQKDSRLMSTVNVERGLTGTAKQIQFVLPTRSEETTGQRFRKTQIKELDVDGRWYYPREFDTTTGESRWDEKKLAPSIMGNGKHLTAHLRAFHLDCDEVIMANILGPAYTGKNGTTVTNLPGGQIVPVDYVYTGASADSGLTAPKLIEGVRILMQNEAWNKEASAMGERLWCVLDATLASQLKQEANLADGDRLYSNEFGGPPEYDANGFLARWGAVNFVIYNSLLQASVQGASGSVTAKRVPLYCTSGFEFGIWGDMSSTVDRRPDLSNAVQFLSQYSIGGGREQEKKVVQINCKA